MPFDGDPSGFGLAVEIEALIFGEGAEGKLAAKARTSRAPTVVPRSAIEWVYPHEPEALEAAIEQMFSPNHTGVPVDDLFSDAPEPPTWTSSAERNRRVGSYMFKRPAYAKLGLPNLKNDGFHLKGVNHAGGSVARLIEIFSQLELKDVIFPSARARENQLQTRSAAQLPTKCVFGGGPNQPRHLIR